MNAPWTHRIAPPLIAISIAACTDTSGPHTQGLVDLFLDFCSTETPAFFAFQNEGSSWTAVPADAAGTFTFKATQKVALAIIHQSGTSFTSEYLFAAASDLIPLSGGSCVEQTGAKTLHGSVANMPAGSATMISMGASSTQVVAPNSSFTLDSLPEVAVYLLARRGTFDGTTFIPDRVSLRHEVPYVGDSAIFVLDFNVVNFSWPIAIHTFTATGLSAADSNFYLHNFHTATTRNISLAPLTAFVSGAQTPLYEVPYEFTHICCHWGKVWHELVVFADRGSTYRGAVHYYRHPANQTVELGPVLTSPTVDAVATTPYLRMRTQLTSQAEYASVVSMSYSQGSDRIVVVTATKGFMDNTPQMWDATIPDLSGVSGFPAESALQSGTPVDWFVEAYGGDGGLDAFYGSPAANAVLRFGGRAATAETRHLSSCARATHRGFSMNSPRLLQIP